MPLKSAPIVVLGTHNVKKGIELMEQLSPRVRILTLADFPHVGSVEETGVTFSQNSVLKASSYAMGLGHWTIGEDSGLCVDALKGAPGVFSARFAGESANDAENNLLLLNQLKGVPQEKRTAHYVCHVTLADPEGTVFSEAEMVCRGRILESPRGEHGFGYDPLFEIVEYHRTFAELGSTVKLFLSHRARAIRAIAAAIEQALGRAQ